MQPFYSSCKKHKKIQECQSLLILGPCTLGLHFWCAYQVSCISTVGATHMLHHEGERVSECECVCVCVCARARVYICIYSLCRDCTVQTAYVLAFPEINTCMHGRKHCRPRDVGVLCNRARLLRMASQEDQAKLCYEKVRESYRDVEALMRASIATCFALCFQHTYTNTYTYAYTYAYTYTQKNSID
jgi:hypothetical protein